MTTPKKEPVVAIVVGKSALTAAAAAISAYVVTGTTVAAGVSAGVVALGEVLARQVADGRSKRIARLWETILDDETLTPEAVAEKVRGQLSDPAMADVVVRTIRDALNAPDEAVVPVLAALAKDYLGASRPIDRFFRGVATMLSTCDAEDLGDLRAVFDAASRGSGCQLVLSFSLPQRSRDSVLIRWYDELGSAPIPQKFLSVDGLRVRNHLVTSNLFLVNEAGGGATFELEEATVARVLRLFSSAAQPSGTD